MTISKPRPKRKPLSRDKATLHQEVNTLKQQLAAMTIERDALRDGLHDKLIEIGNFAHDKSTGPAVPDALWEIRHMVYSAISLEFT